MSKWKNNNVREQFQRASELNVSTAGDTLLQAFINRTVEQITLREFGIQAILDRKQGSGKAWILNRRAPVSVASSASWKDDVSEPTEEVGTYSQVSFEYKTAIARGKITRKLQATGRSYADVLADEMIARAEDFANVLESAFIVGDTAGVIDGSGSNANICNGFLTLCQGINNFDMSQVVNVTGASTANGGMDLSQLDKTIDIVKGSAQRGDMYILGSFAGVRAVNDSLQSVQRFNDTTEIKAGFRVRTYDGIPLIISTEMPNDLEFGANGLISGNAGDGTCLLVLNSRYCYIGELTPTTVIPLAKTSSQFDQFDMYWDGAPVLANTKGIAMLTNIQS